MGHWPLFSIALNYHEKLDLQSMARQPGTSEDRPCVVLFSALMLVCPAQLPPPKNCYKIKFKPTATPLNNEKSESQAKVT